MNANLTNYVLIDFENVHVKSLALLKGDQFRVKVFLGPKNSKLPVELVLAMHELGKSADYIQLGVSSANALDFHITYYLGKLTAQDPEANFHIISKDTGFDSLIKHLVSKGVHCKRAVSIEDMPGVGPAAKPANQTKVATPKAIAPKLLEQKRTGLNGAEPKKAEPKRVEPKKIEPKQTKPKRGQSKTAIATAKPEAVPTPATATSAPLAPAKTSAPVMSRTVQAVVENLQARGTSRPRTIKTLGSCIKSLRLNLSDEQISELVAELQKLGKIKINGAQVIYLL